MTEDEANLKQCCGPEGCGRFNDAPYPARWCVGSSCMAWLWSGKAPEPRMGSADLAIGILGNDEQRRAVAAKMDALRPGYCGLAGASQ